MSYLQSFPKELIDALTWLGKKQWLEITQDGYRISEAMVPALLRESKKYGRRFAEDVGLIYYLCSPRNAKEAAEASAMIVHLHVASKVLSNGPKTVLLSQELCEAFEQTEVNIPFREYRQSFETMVVELPANYGEKKFVPGALDYPTCLAVHHNRSQKAIVIDVVLASSVVSFLLRYYEDATIDDAIELVQAYSAASPAVDKDTAQGRWAPFFRIALNAMLAMTYGVDGNKVSLTPQQRQSKKAIQKRAAGKDKFIAHRARLQLAALPTYFQFDQKIKAFDEHQAPRSLPSNTTGSPKKPHWRRGHWRQQRVGQGRVEQELRWIRPMLIRADRFGGDLKDTTTTYTT